MHVCKQPNYVLCVATVAALLQKIKYPNIFRDFYIFRNYFMVTTFFTRKRILKHYALNHFCKKKSSKLFPGIHFWTFINVQNRFSVLTLDFFLQK